MEYPLPDILIKVLLFKSPNKSNIWFLFLVRFAFLGQSSNHAYLHQLFPEKGHHVVNFLGSRKGVVTVCYTKSIVYRWQWIHATSLTLDKLLRSNCVELAGLKYMMSNQIPGSNDHEHWWKSVICLKTQKFCLTQHTELFLKANTLSSS